MLVMKNVLLVLFIVVGSFNFAFSQFNNLSTNPESLDVINVSNDTVFYTYELNPNSNIELFPEFSLREYFGQNYYFGFVMPEYDDVSIILQYQGTAIAGMTSYSEENDEYQFINIGSSSSLSGSLKVLQRQTQAGEEILVRLWFSEDMSGEEVSIALKKTDAISQTRAISVSSDYYTPQQLVEEVLITGCLEAFNVTYSGDLLSIGYFMGNVGLSGYDEGILLSSGNVEDAAGPDDQTSEGSSTSGGSDPDLAQLVTYAVNDAAILEFDFIPASDTLLFEYIFGSEEFPEYANSSYNDVFGFFLSGPGISGPYSNNAINIALLPNGDFVTIDNLFNNSSYYVGSESGYGGEGLAYNNDIQYDGASVPLVAHSLVQACQTYHIKLAIGDAGDSYYDSGVFFKAGSFTSGASYTATAFNPWYSTDDAYEGCGTYLVFTRLNAESIGQEIPVPFESGGSAIAGVDYTALPDTFYIAAGQMADTLMVNIFEDGVVEGVETLTFTFLDGCPCSQDTMTINIEILDQLSFVPIISNSGPICIGDTATINMTLPPGIDLALVDWEWQLNGSTGYSIEDNPTTTTTYTLEFTYPCTTIEYTSTVEVINPPDVDLGDDYSVLGFTVNLNAGMGAGNTGTWEVLSGPGTGTFIDVNNSLSSVTVDELGVYQFMWTEISLPPNCVSSDTLQIEFYHMPTADFIISSPLCYGDNSTVTFVGEAYDWAVFTWDFGSADVISGSGHGPYEISFPTAGVYEISLVVDENGYIVNESNSVSSPVLLSHLLSIEDDPCFNSCGGSAEIVASGGILPYTYSWGGGESSLRDLCAGNYGITVTDANGCESAENFVISEPTQMTYDTTYENVSCYGTSTGSAEINVAGGVPPYNYIWSNGLTSFQANNLTVGIYSVNVYDSHGCSIAETFIIEEPNSLNVSFTEDMAICEGQIVNLVATPSGGTMPYTIFWSSGNGYNSGAEVQNVSPTETTNFSVYVVDGNGCTSAIADMNLVVSPKITISLDVDDNTCFNSCDGRAELTLNGGISPFNYSWSSDNRILENLCAGLYDVSIVDQIGCSVDTVFYIDEPTEIDYETGSSSASCSYSEDGTAWVTVVGGTSPIDFIWGNGLVDESIQVAGGTYSLTISDANNCRKETEVFVDAPDVMEILSIGSQTICIGGTAELTTNVIGGVDPYIFTWMGEDSTTGFDHIFNVHPRETTSYYLTVTDDNGCYSYSDVTVTVLPELVINSVSANQDTVCVNAPVKLYVDVAGGNGGPYSLQLQDGQIVSSPFTMYPTESQWYYITLSDGCETPSVMDSIYIPVWDIPENMFVSNIVSGCPPLSVTFNETHPDKGYTYLWNYGDLGFGNTQSPTHVYDESGLYNVSLLVRDTNGCENLRTNFSMIEIYPKPIADFFTTPDYVNILHPQIAFHSLTEMADSLFWYFGDGDSAIWHNSTPIHTYNSIGEFGVTLIAVNSHGCKDTAYKVITVLDNPTFYAPTAFTPNGDGNNDCFRVCGNDIDPNEFNMIIYDRWGEIVYETDVYLSEDNCDACGNGAWDGTFNGSLNNGDNLMSTGMYPWYCYYLDNFGILHEQSGVIRLVR